MPASSPVGGAVPFTCMRARTGPARRHDILPPAAATWTEEMQRRPEGGRGEPSRRAGRRGRTAGSCAGFGGWGGGESRGSVAGAGQTMQPVTRNRPSRTDGRTRATGNTYREGAALRHLSGPQKVIMYVQGVKKGSPREEASSRTGERWPKPDARQWRTGMGGRAKGRGGRRGKRAGGLQAARGGRPEAGACSVTRAHAQLSETRSRRGRNV